MQIFRNNRLSLSPGFLLLLAATVITVPIPWIAAGICAAVIHEAGHYMALRLCGKRNIRLHVTTLGMQMETGFLSSGEKLICILAGPAMGSVPLLFIEKFPRLGLCCGILTAVNLLPLSEMDGGNFLSTLLSRYLMPETVQTIGELLDVLCRIGIASLGVWGYCQGFGGISLVISASVLIRCRMRKNNLQILPKKGTIN